MTVFSINEHSHRRYNMLTGEWVQVSPHRAKRPWQGQVEKKEMESRPQYDPDCYLCPGNSRASGDQNPQYTDVYSFTNDFAAIQPQVPESSENSGFFRYKSEKGWCKVICFSPRHDLTIPELPVSDIENVVRLWMDECRELSSKDFINYIQIFENKGSMMGCSNPHPHGQIWSQESIPVEPEKKQRKQAEYFKVNGSSLLGDYLTSELNANQRILFENEGFVILVPFWAVWPYEAMIVPKRTMSQITEMNDKEVKDFSEAYKYLTIKYDNLFEISFPYSAGIHQAPFDGKEHQYWHWHMSFYPPLLRSATVKKFMVGYELLANPQRDLSPEQCAEILRNLSDQHYKTKN